MSKCTLLEKHSSSAPHPKDSRSPKGCSSSKSALRASKPSIQTFHDRFSKGLFEKDRIQAAVAELTEEWNLAESF
jgi:lipoate-protein ligase A